jgi:hypothetical protein
MRIEDEKDFYELIKDLHKKKYLYYDNVSASWNSCIYIETNSEIRILATNVCCEFLHNEELIKIMLCFKEELDSFANIEEIKKDYDLDMLVLIHKNIKDNRNELIEKYKKK